MRLREAFIHTLTGSVGTWRDWQHCLPITLHIRDIIESFNYYSFKIEDINYQTNSISYCNSKRYTTNSATSFPKLIKTDLPADLVEQLEPGFYLVEVAGKDWVETIRFPNQNINFVKKIDSVISSLYNLAYNGNIPNLDYSNLSIQEQKALIKWQKAQAKRFEQKNWNEKGMWPAANEPAWDSRMTEAEAEAVMSEITDRVRQITAALPEAELQWFNNELANIRVGDMSKRESYDLLQTEVDKLTKKLQLVKLCLEL